LICCLPSSPMSPFSIVIVKIAWERELWVFIAVAPTTPVAQNKQHIQIVLGTPHNKLKRRFLIASHIMGRGLTLLIDYLMTVPGTQSIQYEIILQIITAYIKSVCSHICCLVMASNNP
jgi:hypothetical protein